MLPGRDLNNLIRKTFFLKPGERVRGLPKPYSESIEAAWDVVAMFRARDEWDFVLYADRTGWVALFIRRENGGGSMPYMGRGDTESLAICNAALCVEGVLK